MRLANTPLGLTLLVTAAAVGVLSHQQEEDEHVPPSQSWRQVNDHRLTRVTSSHASKSRKRETSPSALSDQLATETRIVSTPLNQVESLAKSHLDELARDIPLRAEQLRQLEPLVIRVTPGYLPEARYRIYEGHLLANLGPNLTRTSFEDELFALLDPEQQLDYAASIAEQDIWWAEIIDRLEADLEQETTPSQQFRNETLPPSVPQSPQEPNAFPIPTRQFDRPRAFSFPNSTQP